MRHFSDKAIETSLEQERDLMHKLAELPPCDKLDRDDIRGLMFILNQYRIELNAIKRDREKAKAGKKTR